MQKKSGQVNICNFPFSLYSKGLVSDYCLTS